MTSRARPPLQNTIPKSSLPFPREAADQTEEERLGLWPWEAGLAEPKSTPTPQSAAHYDRGFPKGSHPW